MARITKGMIKAQQRAEQEYKARYRSVLKRIGTPVLFRIGIMNFLACEEIRNTEDIMEGVEGFSEEYGAIKLGMDANDKYVELRYERTPENFHYYMDVCNHAYSEVEEAIDKMRTCIRVKLESLGTDNPEAKAQIGVTMLVIKLAEDTFVSLRKRIIAKEKIDIITEYGCMFFCGIKNLWDELVFKFAKIPEADEPVDIWKIEGFVDAYREFEDIASSDHFINDCCRWGAALNKEYMPYLYESLLKEVEEKEE